VVIPADRSALLRGLPLFERVHPELLDLLAGTALERRVPPHQRLASKGESFPFLGIVFEGSVVALASSASGRQQLLYEATPCDSFGEISLLDEGSTLSQFAAGDRGATFMMVPKRALEIACGSEPALALRIARLAAHRARVLTQRLADLAFDSTTTRIVRIILSFCPDLPAAAMEAEGQWIAAPSELLRLTQSQLAERAGTVRIVASRVLRSLAKNGNIVLDRGRIARLNPVALARML
jgi:CRP-like cAMP-binding protein